MATIWGWKDFDNSSSIEAVLCKRKNNKNEKNESPNPMLPLAIIDQNKQFKIIFTTVYIGKFMIDSYFCFVPCSQGKCVTTQPGIKSEATCSQ